ncbi:MAG TPA: alpha/beta fold hydrolase [Nocardioidaceae bacterium]|nr:alpha/beta fold hydrolase [Nocardioidaceae bacterium]
MRALAALLLAIASLGVTAPAQAVDEQPWSAYPTLDRDPVGANDWTCTPTAERPHPAVIVHGTFGDRASLLDALSFSLSSDGYCVFALDYGDRATAPVEESAAELKEFVDRVLAETGASRVSLVGHSQGGMMPRYYIKYLGGDGLVEDLVGLAPSNHGTTVSGEFGSGSAQGCASCDQQQAGSEFLRDLNAGDETPGDVDYTQVVTRYDEVVVPYTSGFLTGERSTNITLQDYCAADPAEHLTIPTDRQAIAWVLDAFDREGPADPTASIGCL